MKASRLIEHLKYWQKTLGTDPEITLSVITSGPTLSRGNLMDVFSDLRMKKVVLFGGEKK